MLWKAQLNNSLDQQAKNKFFLPVHRIIFSLPRYFIVSAVFDRHSSERKGGSANTRSKECSVMEADKSRGFL